MVSYLILLVLYNMLVESKMRFLVFAHFVFLVDGRLIPIISIIIEKQDC